MKKILLSILGIIASLQISYAAITFDSTTATTATCSVSSKTYAHTVGAGSNRILFVPTSNHTALGTITGVTYAGVAMTNVNIVSSGGTTIGLWYLIAPSTGTNNVVITASAAGGCLGGGAISFFGASQTGQPDASSVGGPTTTTSYSQSVTSVADNSFAVLALGAASGATLTGGSNTTIGSQPEVAAHGTAFAYSTAGKTPAGTFTLNVTSANQSFKGVMASFSPAASAPASTPSTLGFFRYFRHR